MSQTISTLTTDHDAKSRAIGAPDREWLSYGGLQSLAVKVRKQLHEIGIGRGDRVAIVLPNGPEMATAFFSIAQAATTAPLNPAYREEEYEFYLDDLKAKALVVSADYDGPAISAAQKVNIAVLRLSYRPS